MKEIYTTQKLRKWLALTVLFICSMSFSAMAQNEFITTWQTTSSPEAITVPTFGTGYNYSVDWGDGSSDDNLSSDLAHVYTNAGTYTVKVTGDFPRIYFADGPEKDKILTIEQWGNVAWTSMDNAFSGCSNLTYNATDAPNLAGVTSLKSMFASATLFNGDVSNWDVSTITNMQSMFANSAFNQDISGWSVGSVTNMNGMFYQSSFNQDLSSWDISSAINLADMFGLSSMSTQNYDNTLIGWAALTLPPSNITFSAASMQYCNGETARTTLTNTYNWSFSGDSKDCSINNFITTWETTTPNESITIPTTGAGYNYTVDWGDGSSDTGVGGNATHQYTAAGTYTVSISGAFPRIYFNNAGDKTKIKTIEQWGDIAWDDMYSAFYGCTDLTYTATDNPDLTQVLSMDQMFREAHAFNGAIGGWDVSNVTSMSNMFYNANSFNQPLNLWVVSEVTMMAGMFERASQFNQDISAWDVRKVQYLSAMFRYASSFNQDIGIWQTESLINLNAIFLGATSFNQNISSWDVSGVGNIGYAFYNANSFDQSLSSWDISSATDLGAMLDNSAMSKANYDATLLGWVALPTPPSNISFGATGLTYCDGETARNTLTNTYNWTFSGDSKDCPDTTPPTIVSFSPTDDETNVGIGVNFVATFSEPIKLAAASDNIVLYRNGGAYLAFGESDDQVSVSGNVITINFTEDLQYGHDYSIWLRYVTDLSDNSYTGHNNTTTWNFTTEELTVVVNDADFKTYLLTLVDAANGGNNDGEIQISEAEAFTGKINYTGNGLTDATGLEAFINVTHIALNFNSLTTMDLSKNVDITALELFNNDLTTINLDQNVLLDFLNLEGNALEAINLQNNTLLTEVRLGQNGGISTLDVSANTALITLYLDDNSVTSLEISSNTLLETLYLGNNAISTIDLSNNTALLRLELEDNQLTTIDVTNNTFLEYLVLRNMNIPTIDLSQNVELTELYMTNTSLTTLDVSKNINLETLEVYTNSLTTLDLNQNTALMYLYLEDNSITSLDLSANINLAEVYLNGNSLTQLNLANGNNVSISTIDLTLNPSLSCVKVDDVDYATSSWTDKDAGTSFSLNCPVSQSITFNALSERTYCESFDLTATASSGLAVSYESSNLGVATISGSTVTITGVGTTTITANQTGDTDYLPANSVDQLLTVIKADQTISINAITDKFIDDSAFDVVASTTSALSLSYAIQSGPATISGATITLDGTVGTVVVEVSQAGDLNYNVASQTTSFNITDPNMSDQTITFEALPDVTYGVANFNLTATASSSLAVSYSVISGPATIAGSTVTITGAGSVTIEATQEGNASFAAAPAVQQSFTVNKADQTINLEAIADQDISASAISIIASATSGLDVALTVTGPATINGTTITLDGIAGTVTVFANQPGDANYNSATEVTTSFEVIDITMQCSEFLIVATTEANMCFGGATGSIDISVSGGSGNYAYSWSNGATTEDISGLSPGTYNVTVSDNDLGCEQFVVAEVADLGVEIIITSTTTEVMIGNDGAADITVTGGTSPYSYSWSNGSQAEDLLGVVAGTYTVTVTDANGCTQTLEVTVGDIITGTERDIATTSINFYPNPVKENLTIALSLNKATDVTIQILDVSGRVMLIQTKMDVLTLNNNIDISGFKNGQYMLMITTDKSRKVERFVVAK